MPPDATELTAVELGLAYRTRELAVTDVVAAYLARVRVGPVYRELLEARALEQAEQAQRQFDAGIDAGPLQGVPLAIKDLLDVEGTVTAAGSRVLASGPVAAADAPAVARCDAAGAVFLGKTNMTELAFSGIGVNPHFGTPPNVFDGDRIPGGSSSGSAVAVAAKLACLAIGSDTGGSVRVPAAFNGVVGLKPSEGAIPTDGAVPLSFTLDTIGPIARTPADAWLLYRTMAALPPAPVPELPRRLQLCVPAWLTADLDPAVDRAFRDRVAVLEAEGHAVEEIDPPLIVEIAETLGRLGGFGAHEALAVHGDMLERHGDLVDPRVAGRVLQAAGRSSRDYLRLVLARREWCRRFWEELSRFDAVMAPTVPILPPRFDELEADEDYFRLNSLVLRNTSLFNTVGGTSISVPSGGGPTGVMFAAAPGGEGLVTALGELATAGPRGAARQG